MKNEIKTKVDLDFAFSSVPKNQKKGFLSMFSIMLGFTFFSASMWTGGILGSSLSMSQFIQAVLLGNLILGAYTGLLAYMASDTGLSTHLLARYSFGVKGSFLPSAILGITQVGWFGVGVAMFAVPVHKITNINIYLLIVIAGALMTFTAYFGIKSLTILSMIAVPSIFLLGSYSINLAVDSIGGINELFKIVPSKSISMVTAVSLCIGSFISGGSLTPDFTRFSKNKSSGVMTTFIAFFIGNSLMFLFGAIGAMVIGEADISEVMLKQGIIIPAIIILGFNIWTTNDNALYASGLAFSNITGLEKKLTVIFNGVIGTLGAMVLYNHFVSWLNILNSIIPAIGGVLIADYFFVNRKNYKDIEKMNVKIINYNAIISWVIGVISAYTLPGVQAINGVIVASLAFIITSKFFKLSVKRKIEKEA